MVQDCEPSADAGGLFFGATVPGDPVCNFAVATAFSFRYHGSHEDTHAGTPHDQSLILPFKSYWTSLQETYAQRHRSAAARPRLGPCADASRAARFAAESTEGSGNEMSQMRDGDEVGDLSPGSSARCVEGGRQPGACGLGLALQVRDVGLREGRALSDCRRAGLDPLGSGPADCTRTAQLWYRGRKASHMDRAGGVRP